MTIEIFTSYFLAVFFTFVAVFYTVRIVFADSAKRSVKLVHHGQPFSTQWFTHTTFRIFRVAIWGICVFRVPFPELNKWLLYCTGVVPAWVYVTGLLLLSAGFILALIGHGTLGKDWRSGVDPTGPSRIINSGIYSRSRNPMFIGEKLALVGLLFALPSGFSILCLLAGWIALDYQVKVEEMHLRLKFNNDYQQYQNNVPRWL